MARHSEFAQNVYSTGKQPESDRAGRIPNLLVTPCSVMESSLYIRGKSNTIPRLGPLA